MGNKCQHQFGCHHCLDTLTMLHCAIRQVLVEKAINQDRIRRELISVKDFIEDILNYKQEDE